MSKLRYEEFPDISSKKIDSVNSLSDSELQLEIDKGRSSRFKETMIPVLKLALTKRQNVVAESQREEDLSIAKEYNLIAKSALEQAVKANKKSDQTRIWSAVAVLITVFIAAIGWLQGWPK